MQPPDGKIAPFCSCLVNLMLTGRASPYIHNGIIVEDEVDKLGIQARNDIGLLIWERSEAVTDELRLGSRFKTPGLPVWVTCVRKKCFISTCVLCYVKGCGKYLSVIPNQPTNQLTDRVLTRCTGEQQLGRPVQPEQGSIEVAQRGEQVPAPLLQRQQQGESRGQYQMF